jgi:hypothetical protein
MSRWLCFIGVLLAFGAVGPALAYDTSWHKEAGWSGEYPNGFTMEADVTIPIRASLDLNAPKSISCILKKGASYHEWNKKRVASDRLKFVSFTKIETYEVNADFTVRLERKSNHRDTVIKFKKGDRWSYLYYGGEGLFLMRFGGSDYFADQDLIANSTEVGSPIDNKQGYDEWLGLKCANGAVGWILFREIRDTPGFGASNITGYGNAEDEPQSPPTRRRYWEHNGSEVYEVAEGETRQFLYSQPRAGMLEAGARPDDLLFSGRLSDDHYSGTAYIFNRRCGRLPYRVSGPVLDHGNLVVLHGLAPRVDHSCRVRSKFEDTLKFHVPR